MVDNASRPHRGTIYVDECEVVSQTTFDAGQYVLRVRSAKIAATATPGSFAHLTCDPAVPMRRPLSIMRVSADKGWIEFLYKVVGGGLSHLASRRPGDTVSVMGPIGRGFAPRPARPRLLMVGGGVGIPPMVFLAEHVAAQSVYRPLVLMGSEIPFPFRAKPSAILVPGLPNETIACMPLLDELGVPSRLASWSDFPGCYHGYVTDLAARWLESLDPAARAETELFACGPTAMLASAAAVAKRFDVPCQVSLEEYMACAVGGCAGCTVKVRTPQGPAMKRVCVDGPVFDAATVF